MTTKPGLKFSVAAIDNVKEILKALPPAPRETKEVSLREAIEELAPAIRGLLAKGYSRQQVVDLIQEQGVGCSLTSLKAYFRTPAKTKAKSSAGPTAGPMRRRDRRRDLRRQVRRQRGSWSAAALAGRKWELLQRLATQRRPMPSRQRAEQPVAKAPRE